MEETYICRLSQKHAKQAIDELNEDPKDRLSSVAKLKEWVEQQRHLVCKTDTAFLLKILRTAKFSQLRAREKIEEYLTLKVDLPKWLLNWNPYEEHVQQYFKASVFVPLPGYCKDGSKPIVHRFGAVPLPKAITKEFKDGVVRSWYILISYVMMTDENAQVGGITFIMDFTDVKMNTVTLFNISESKDVVRWQHGMPGRFKGFWHYNESAVIDVFLLLFKPFLKKKFIDRLKFFGANLEKLYQEIPKSNLPEEYLPDDYRGPNAGSFDSLAGEFWKGVTKPEILQLLTEESDPKWKIDKSIKPADEPSESFRKLNID